jgi:hypothetical protein
MFNWFFNFYMQGMRYGLFDMASHSVENDSLFKTGI